jgi:asparagine synthase (glutamine-hydrolysing)
MIEVKVYDGLIRNHVELAEELGVGIDGLGRREREELLIAAAWERWGEDMGNHLNGQFAFALYDAETDELFCARDPLGAELFFYYETEGGRLLYGTQIKDLFGQPGFEKRLNREMVQFFLGFTYVPGEETLFAGVRKLEPGGFLRFGKGGLTLGRYWELTFEPDESKSLDDWANEISDAMDASLKSICDEGEVPDSFLSGGVDSSYILAKSNARKGFCCAYENQVASEEDDARATAEYLGRDFEGITVSSKDFFADVDEFLVAYEQPSSDVAGLALYSACKKMVGKTELCFSGEGADEFFAGYSVYQNTRRLRMSPDPVYFGTTYIMNNAEQKRYLKKFYPSRSARAFMKERGAGGKQYDMLGWMLYVDLRSYFEGSILFNSTKIARGTGLDIRMPYCDLRIFDIARRMPSRFKAAEGRNKIALRAAASRVLPQEVAYRKKLGFPVPVREWLADSAYNADIRRAFESEAAAEFFDLDEIGALLDAFLGKKPRVNHPIWFPRHKALLWRHVWTIYVFIRWYELFFQEM